MTTTQNTWLNEAHRLLVTARRWHEGELPRMPGTTAGSHLMQAAFDFFECHTNCRQSETLMGGMVEWFPHGVAVLAAAVEFSAAVATHSTAAGDCWHAFRVAVDRFNSVECGILQEQQMWRLRN